MNRLSLKTLETVDLYSNIVTLELNNGLLADDKPALLQGRLTKMSTTYFAFLHLQQVFTLDCGVRFRTLHPPNRRFILGYKKITGAVRKQNIPLQPTC
ncbi:unnamed protein product [Larinioides sclopetarius]|uniref:Uncharacterized protein n=1 Tax=Larinioides sclopetarius TaxID=280406 RepID=A0AAV1YP59_9ARAC